MVIWSSSAATSEAARAPSPWPSRFGSEGRVDLPCFIRGRWAWNASWSAGVGAAAIRLRDELPIVERVPAGGVSAIGEELSALKSTDLVVIDGLDALLPGAGTTEEEEAATIRALKRLALDARTAVLVTSPLPHLGVRDDRRPVLDDFGARGAVKERADVVLALFREGMYDGARGIEGATELLVRKNRNGGTGYVDLYFYDQWMRFEDMLDPDR